MAKPLLDNPSTVSPASFWAASASEKYDHQTYIYIYFKFLGFFCIFSKLPENQEGIDGVFVCCFDIIFKKNKNQNCKPFDDKALIKQSWHWSCMVTAENLSNAVFEVLTR